MKKTPLAMFTLSLLLLPIFSISAVAQQATEYGVAIEGIVMDYETGEPINNVTVNLILGSGVVVDEAYLNHTDSVGRYSVYDDSHADPRGELSAYKEGYMRYKQTIDAIDGTERYINIEMSKEESFDQNAPDSVKVYGRVSDYETGNPLKEVRVKAGAVTFEGGSYAYQANETYTDKNGYYEMWIKPNYYSVEFYKYCEEKEYHYDRYIFSKHFEPGEEVKKDATLIYEFQVEGSGGTAPANDTPGFGVLEFVGTLGAALLFLARRKKS
ncbi:MAG: hypothetical protein CVT48_05250 [Thermoplasmata archaeon HGW-Thermoplasmata-1]|nr:MAG: hypothetical protein CVT48_05250 [Thermoplasmata archaeon HGW-Thermoplasmata-1]